MPAQAPLIRLPRSEFRAKTGFGFGFCPSCRDRLSGTCAAEPAQGRIGMVIGAEGLREDRERRADRPLARPFKG